MAHRDTVSPELAQRVIDRDREQMWVALRAHGIILGVPAALSHRVVCVAPVVDAGEINKCWGRTTIEHVKLRLRMGVRAESTEATLVALCDGHTERGMRGGRQWNTTKENRAKIRDYLVRANR